MLWYKASELALENGTVVACGYLMEAAFPLANSLVGYVDRLRIIIGTCQTPLLILLVL